MKTSRLLSMKTLLLAFLLPIIATAQLRTPENIPVSFYGKIIDQHGNPIVGAKINFTLVISHLAEFRTESIPGLTLSDQGGLFQIAGATGCGIDKISIQKNGYELSPKTVVNYGFGPNSNYSGNATNPLIFKMWKQQGKEPLISSSWHGKAACDGTTNLFDLLHGQRSADGTLKIICSKIPLTVPPPGNAHFDYKFEIAVIGGGIQAAEDEFTYLAPENGYSASFLVAQKRDDLKWRSGLKQEFYIKTAEGHYGRLYVEWYASQTPPVHLEWNCSINPSGSRNLER